MRSTIGFSIHTGWAAAVVVSDKQQVVARLRIDIADPDGAGLSDMEHGSRFLYHIAAESGEPLAKTKRRIEAARKSAIRRAESTLRSLIAEHSIVRAALPPQKRKLPELEAILRSHPLIHTAESEFYRGALAEACRNLGLDVLTPAPKPPRVGKIGPPWAKDQKDAAALAWAALSV